MLAQDTARNAVSPEDDPVDAADTEVATLMHRLTHLEYFLGSYDNLCVIKTLKDAIADHVDIGQQADTQTDVSVAKLSHRKGLEPVRLKLLNIVNAAIEQVNDSEELLATAFPDSCSANKKKRGVNYFSSFNFDDLPAFEPLETTLQLLRADASSTTALQKLMALEVGELIEHPQWFELLSLLGAALESAPTSEALVFVIHLYVRFIDGLEGQQSIDLVANLLKYYWKMWGKSAPREAEEQGPPPQRASLSALAGTQVRAFLYVLKRCESSISQCSDNSAEVVISTIFLLLACGEVEATPLLQAIAETDASGSAGLSFVRSMKPVMIVTYAIHSRLLPVLMNLLHSQLRSTGGGDIAGGEAALRRFVLHATLLFELTAPFFGKSVDTLNFITRTTAQGLQQEGKELTGGSDIVLEPVAELNKLFSQLSGMPPVWAEIRTARAGDGAASPSSSANDFPSLLASMGKCLCKMVTSCAPRELVACQPAVLSIVESLLSFLQHDKSWTQESLIMTCCAEIVIRLVQVTDTEAGAYAAIHKYLFCLGSLTLSARRTRESAEHIVQAWLSVTTLAFSFCSKYGGSEGAKKVEGDGAGGVKVTQLQHEILTGWHALLLFVRDVSRHLAHGADIPLEMCFNGSQFVDMLGDMTTFAVGRVKTIVNKVEGVDTVDQEAANAQLRSQCVGVATAFLISATSYQPFIVATLSQQPCLALDVVDILLSSVMGKFKLNEAMTGAEFHGTGVCESLVQLCRALGEEVLLEAPSCTAFVDFVNAQTTDVYVWDFNQVWYEGESILATVLEFLCGLTFAGHEELAFLVLRRAWEPLDELCTSMSVHSLAQLLSLGENALALLSCESFYEVFLRVAHVALLNPSFCCRIRAYRADMINRTKDPIGQEISSSGYDLHALFCKALESRVVHLVCTKKYWRPFFMPFTEGDLTQALTRIAAEDPTHMRSLLTSLPKPLSTKDSLALDIFAGNIGISEISRKLSAHTEKIASNAGPADALVGSASCFGAAVFGFLGGGQYDASTAPILVSDDDATVHWLAACSHLIGVSTRHQYRALLQSLGADSDTALVHKIIQISMVLLGRYREGRMHNVLARLHVCSETVIRTIVSQWFSTYLRPEDLALVTAATWVAGAQQAAMVAVAITVAIGDVLQTSKRGWGSRGGAEAVTRAICDPSFADFSISDNRILNDLRVLVAEL